MSRPRSSRARWDAQRQALILPLPERVVIRAAAQFGSGILGIEMLGTWLRRFVLAAAATPRGRPSGNLRTKSGQLLTRAKWELANQIKQKSLKPSKIK